MGLNIFPSIQRKLARRRSLSAYLKYAPLLTGASILNILDNAELALGFESLN